MVNTHELVARIRAGERVSEDVIKAAVAELRQGRASAAQSERKKGVSKGKAATAAALDALQDLFK